MMKFNFTRLLAVLALAFSFSALAADLPDLSKTPGAVRTDQTKAEICSTKWGKDARHVSAATKRQVFALYGYTGNNDPKCIPAGKRRCEVDHLISRELGGADVIENLWPQSYGSTPWNAVLKDKLENRLHKEMCANRISLKKSRDMLVNDWRIAYKEYYGEP